MTTLPGQVLADEAFTHAFEQHATRVLRLARLLGASDPEDVAQEAFLRLYAARGRLTDAERMVSYLNRIVANEVRARHRRALVVLRHRHREAVPPETDPLGRHHESVAVVAALDLLTQRQREAVVLRYWLDLPLAEIAAVMGVRPGTAKSSLSRALARLGTLLEDPT